MKVLSLTASLFSVRVSTATRNTSNLFSSTVHNRNIKSMSSSSLKDSLLNCPSVPMNGGKFQHPSIGFGTYKVGFIPASASATTTTTTTIPRTAEDCILDALDVGYRFLECAEFYGNEAEIGKALSKSGIPREELFLCSKVWTTTIEKGPNAIRAQLEQTLKDLGTEYVDLYLIHWPVPGKHVEAYKALEVLCKEGKIRGVGLSNYTVEDYLELKENNIEIVPSVNQIEINPFLYRKKTIDFFKKEGIVLQSYRSLCNGKAFTDPTLTKIAKSHNKTVAQILGRWCIQNEFIYVPKSEKKQRMMENANVFDFNLSDNDMKELDSLTTLEALETFQKLYQKCVNRDTTKDGTLDGVKMEITLD